MDRRRRKTRAAIFSAFEGLLAERSYASITVRDIIERADVGRTTFYDNFETKDDLLRELCEELFDHVTSMAGERAHRDGQEGAGAPSVFLHLLQHLIEDSDNVLRLLAGESGGVFTRYFTDSLEELVSPRVSRAWAAEQDIPVDYLVDLAAGSFVEMVQWWVRGGLKQSPEELDRWYRAALGNVLA